MTGSDFKICVYKGEYDLVAVFDDVDFPYTMLKVPVPKGFVCEA